MSAIESTEELADLIASFEAERQAAAREKGNAAAGESALRKLQALQTREKEALASGPSEVHSVNLAMLVAEISRVQKLTGTTNRLGLPPRTAPDERSAARRGQARPPLRSRGRKTTGRSSGR